MRRDEAAIAATHFRRAAELSDGVEDASRAWLLAGYMLTDSQSLADAVTAFRRALTGPPPTAEEAARCLSALGAE